MDEMDGPTDSVLKHKPLQPYNRKTKGQKNKKVQKKQGNLHRTYGTRVVPVFVLSLDIWRGRIARRELRKLKMAAQETGALKEAKDKLEKQLEELTWRLQLEKHLRVHKRSLLKQMQPETLQKKTLQKKV